MKIKENIMSEYKTNNKGFFPHCIYKKESRNFPIFRNIM